MSLDVLDVTTVMNDAGFPVGVRAEDGQRRAYGTPLVIWGGPLVDLPITGSTAESSPLVTFDIPPGLVTPRSRMELRMLWSANNNANAKTVRVKLNGAVLVSNSLANNASALAQAEFFARAGQALALPTMLFTTSGSVPAVVPVDWSAAVQLTITGQLANAGDTMTLVAHSLTLYPQGF